uniref:Transposase n=1 Tax=Knipowitschia caucasica TaxID=637954 RepID=A0AAV2JMW0_KNICA
MPIVPKHRWLMQVYAQDVLSRLGEVKASITSLSGQVLKLDSTKKIVRKLAGSARSTAAWAANVGNEFGQVIMSVLTASEGWGLAKMAEGLVNRYKQANFAPPRVLYTDRDCCKNSHLHKIFGGWPNLCIRLDVWHFMRRIAVGCTTDSHPLYSGFMAQLSRCIFVWDQSDLQRLIEAKRAELEACHLHPSDDDVRKSITKKEMQLHCKRAVRPAAEMEVMLGQ